MSANKTDVDTKIFEMENTDSGIFSGPLNSEEITQELNPVEESKEIQDETKQPGSNFKDGKSCSTDLHEQHDSGLISAECLSEDLEQSPCAIQVSEQPLIVIDSDDTWRRTSLDEQKYDLPTIKLLFEQDEDGDTQLHIAAVHGCEKSVTTLIRVCPDRELLDIRNSYGHTALHLAVLAGHPYIAKMLMDAGASIAVRDFNGETPLHLAIQKKYIRSLIFLLSLIREQPRKLTTVLNQKNYSGQTCVHLAATKGFLEELKMLVAHGANVNAQEGLAGRTALHIASQREDYSMAAYLLGEGGAERGTRDYAGRSARRIAKRTRLAPLFDDDYSDDDDSESEYESDTERFEEMSQMLATTTC